MFQLRQLLKFFVVIRENLEKRTTKFLDLDVTKPVFADRQYCSLFENWHLAEDNAGCVMFVYVSRERVSIHHIIFLCVCVCVCVCVCRLNQRGSYMVWEINMGVCPHFEFNSIMFINCLGCVFYIFGAFEFLCSSIAKF